MKFLEARVPPPLVAALTGLTMWLCAPQGVLLEASQSPLRIVALIVLVLLGAGVSLAGLRSFRRAKTTVNPLKPERATQLVDTGIYQLTRNPMYLGMLLVLLGWAAALASWWGLLGPLAFALYMSRFQIGPEEQALLQLFGGEFEVYKGKVRRWL